MSHAQTQHIWSLVHDERRALIHDLAQLDEAAWQTPSLCPGWTVHDVAAHLVNNAKATTFRLFVEMAKAGFNFDRQNAAGVARERGATPAITLDRLRAVANRTHSPPVDLASRLVEEIVHGEDIRRVLQIERAYPAEAVMLTIDYQAKTSVGMGGAKQRLDGLTLSATDFDCQVGHGSSHVVGPGQSILLAISGRREVVADLTGSGTTTLVRSLDQ